MFVYPHPIDPGRGSLTVAVDGPPVVMIEVRCEATYEADMDLVRGKGYSYARAGVRAYLALDPTGAFLPERGHGWRLVARVYRLWEPDAAARWQSEQIGAAIGLEAMLATVCTREGERPLREGEVAQERAQDRAELERLRAELKRLRDRMDEQQGGR